MLSAPSPADCISPDGEPLCLPPPPEELCDAARRRLPEVEADLRRRLSGPDRSIEAAELERLAAGLRQPLELVAERPQGAASASDDPLLEQGLLALCAAQLLGARPLLHLPEGLALRGQRVRRGTLGRGGPPRALEVVDQIHRGERIAWPTDRGSLLDVCRGGRDLPAARALVALSEAALAPPLVLIDSPAASSAGQPFLYAGLPPALLPLLSRAAAPHGLADAAAPLSPLRESLAGRNPWHLFQLALAPWRDAWAGTQVLREPQLTAAGLGLAHEVLGRPPTPDEAFALACSALGAAERLATLPAQGPAPGSGEPAPVVDESVLAEEEARLLAALARLSRRPLLPGRGGEAALLLRQAAQSGLLVLMAHHREELGRALLPLPAGGPGGLTEPRAAQLRLFSFPREPPRALAVSERLEEGGRRSVCLDGGDLRAQIVF